MAEFEPLPAEWLDPANHDAVAAALAPPHVVVELHDTLDAPELERLRSVIEGIPDRSTVVLDIDCDSADLVLGRDLLALVTALRARGSEVGCLIRGNCPGPLTWAVLIFPTGAMAQATFEGSDFTVGKTELVDQLVARKPGASRRTICRLLRDDELTAVEVIRGGLAFPSGDSGSVAYWLLKELETRLDRGEV